MMKLIKIARQFLSAKKSYNFLYILRSKKAANDVTLIWTIITIFIVLGATIPIIEGYFSDVTTTYNTEGVEVDIGQKIPELSANPLSIIEFGKSILAMFFWAFNVHWMINLFILMPMRVILYILLYRQIRSGGG